jgi:hypothetical protein
VSEFPVKPFLHPYKYCGIIPMQLSLIYYVHALPLSCTTTRYQNLSCTRGDSTEIYYNNIMINMIFIRSDTCRTHTYTHVRIERNILCTSVLVYIMCKHAEHLHTKCNTADFPYTGRTNSRNHVERIDGKTMQYNTGKYIIL